MGDHLVNPQAMARAQGKQMVRAIDLGDGVALVGFELQPLMAVPAEGEEASVAVGLFAIGGKSSPLSLNVELRAVLVTEFGRVTLAHLKRLLVESAETESAKESTPQ